MNKITAFLAAACLFAALPAFAAQAECIVPSKPGGAMDLTCKLAQRGLRAGQGDVPPMRLTYLPGGIGAVAWHTLVSQRRAEADTLVAFSGGSLLNLAQGKFGKATAGDVRWVAALGADYGMIAVGADSPYKTLGELLAALKRNPKEVLIGVSGTIGSQDWLKMALVARKAGIDPKALRFVALEGGGEAFTAMDANYVHVVSGDASEATLYSEAGKTRILAHAEHHRTEIRCVACDAFLQMRARSRKCAKP
jgi:putative tricarboxylic transport membrane protein